MDEILGKGYIVRVPRGTLIWRGSTPKKTGKAYTVCLYGAYGPIPHREGWDCYPINNEWDKDYVVVWIGSGNLYMQARMQDVVPIRWTQEEVDDINKRAEDLYSLLGPENEPQAD